MVCAIYINININIKGKNPLYYTLKKVWRVRKSKFGLTTHTELSYVSFLFISLSRLQEKFCRPPKGHSKLFFGCSLHFVPFSIKIIQYCFNNVEVWGVLVPSPNGEGCIRMGRCKVFQIKHARGNIEKLTYCMEISFSSRMRFSYQTGRCSG